MIEKKESKLYQKHRNIKFHELKRLLKNDIIKKSQEEIDSIINSYINEESIKTSIKSNLHQEFSHLIRSELTNLKNELNEYPEYIELSDNNGRTLLHHLAIESHNLSTIELEDKLNLLVEKGFDFNKKTDLGDTAAHIVALRGVFQIINLHHFRFFISSAVDNDFNMNILGAKGKTVLQIASSLRYKNHRFFDPISNVQTLLECIPNLNLDRLSASGATALFYAIKACRLDEATILLNAGADPFEGNSESKTLNLIDRYLANNDYAAINFELNELKQMILKMLEEAIPEPVAHNDKSFNY
ncbi:MAG: ankyrin repeat domain-containing protein [Tatlockia sp.]|nr:ankyrin repeat domain-containing protein [Tatlockia sp.]